MTGIARLGVEVLLIGALIYLGWNKPYQEWAQQITGRSWNNTTEQRPGIRQPVVSATPSGAWMRDPNHRTILDTPAPVTTGHAERQGSSVLDANHRTALDAPHRSGSPH